MSDEVTVEPVEPIEEAPVVDVVETPTEDVVEDAQTDAPVRKRRRTKKVAEENSDVIVDATLEEAAETTNDDGQEVITGPKEAPRRAPKSNTFSNDDGIIGSNAADRSLGNKPVVKEEKEKPKANEDEQVAVWSKGNIRWTGVGALSKGYNIVTKEAAEKWLSREGIREATPEEVATYYGK